jgi:hypothetical protein
MYLKPAHETLESERFECSCFDLQHTIRISYDEMDFSAPPDPNDVYSPTASFEIEATWWEQWYKRVWTAVKYVFKKDDYYYAGISMDKKEDIVKMRDLLTKIIDKWPKQ